MSSTTTSSATRPLRPPVVVPVSRIAEATFAPVYAVRTHDDLERIVDLTTPRSLDPMGHYLVDQGVITTEDLKEALAIQRNSANRRLGWILCKLGHLDELTLGRLLAAHFGVPCVTLEHYRPAADYRQRLPDPIAGEGSVAVLHEDERHAWIAASDVTNQQVIKDANAWLRRSVSLVMAGREEIARYRRGEEAAAPNRGGARAEDPQHLKRSPDRTELSADTLSALKPYR